MSADAAPDAPWLAPVLVGRSVDAVTDRLATAIAAGHFSPGERLPPERELAALLRVGRPTLREALTRLRDAGYIVTRRGRTGGAIVQDGWGQPGDHAMRRTPASSQDELAELSDLRCLIESLIARTAAERRQPADVAAMRAALADHESAQDSVAARRSDHELHQAVAAAAGNRHLAHLSRELLARVDVGPAVEPATRELRRRAVPQHRALVDAIANGDADAAAAVAREHFTQAPPGLGRSADVRSC